ncbi:glycosyltransferase family 4 protein [Psychrobacillus sp.]|uniref:glycosyltransferase family 4 protein n=1 Tax=Psychrobacillus sp. TaxID=1871623 RepID=UPI0028BEB37A|nr:glycosyltransferase family 4 protein [Psychrobacillus sp.]
MKILLATFWIIPHVGGVWNYMSQLKKVLESLGHEVDILGYGEGNKYVYIVNEFRKVERSLLLPLVNDKLNVQLEPENYADPVVKHCETERHVYELGASYLGLEKYDVIHTQDVISTVCLNRVKPIGPTLVATLHGCVAHEMRLQTNSSPTSYMCKAYFDELEHVGATSATFTIVANEWLKNILTDEFHVPNEQIKILNYGYDTANFLKKIKEKPFIQLQHPVERPVDKKTILYTGRLVELKGVHHLISSLSHLKKIRSDWVCWIVGEGEKRAELQVQSKALGVENDIFFLGKREDIPKILSNTDIFVLPSLIENQSLSVIEAQITGKAVIVSDAGGLPEMVEHGVTGLISPVGDVMSLCNNLESLIKNESYRQELGSNAKKWGMVHWSLEAGVKKVVEVYELALSIKGGVGNSEN